MGYDVTISRKQFIEKKDLPSNLFRGDSKEILLTEHLFELNGWDISGIVQSYIEENIEELDVESVIELYEEVCETQGRQPSQKLLEIMNQDIEEDVYYELSQSY